jgi:type I restriction enzyme R subunit
MLKQPEIAFQKHIADLLVREHGYGVLEQTEITDLDYAIAEDHLWAFLKDTQADNLRRLAEDYGTVHETKFSERSVRSLHVRRYGC